MSAEERGKCLIRLGDLIDKHAEELATIESMDNGKPFKFAKGFDMVECAKSWRYFG